MFVVLHIYCQLSGSLCDNVSTSSNGKLFCRKLYFSAMKLPLFGLVMLKKNIVVTHIFMRYCLFLDLHHCLGNIVFAVVPVPVSRTLFVPLLQDCHGEQH